jgi:hypothetical protein
VSLCPLRCEGALRLGASVESFLIVLEPEEELQILWGMFNVLEVVEKLSFCARLKTINILRPQHKDIPTGQHPSLIILSKDSSSGTPLGFEGMDFIDDGVSSEEPVASELIDLSELRPRGTYSGRA